MAAHPSSIGATGLDASRGIAIWFIALGALLTALGAIAALNLVLATVATMFLVAAMMFAGGIAQIVHATGLRRRGAILAWLLAGILYLLAGAALMYDPLFAAAMLTLLLAAFLGASGLVRAGFALVTRPAGWGWLLGSGVLSMAAAAVIAMGWPVDTLWVLGLLLAVDLLVQGISLMFVGFALRQTGRTS